MKLSTHTGAVEWRPNCSGQGLRKRLSTHIGSLCERLRSLYLGLANLLVLLPCRYYNENADNQARKNEGIQSSGTIPTAQH